MRGNSEYGIIDRIGNIMGYQPTCSDTAFNCVRITEQRVEEENKGA